jgi:hypothetical protein
MFKFFVMHRYVKIFLCVVGAVALGSLAFTVAYRETLTQKYDEPSFLDLWMLMNMRVYVNILSIPFAAFFSFIDRLIAGFQEMFRIGYNELMTVLRMLEKLYNSWFVQQIWDAVAWVMNFIGWLLTPFVRLLWKAVWIGLIPVSVWLLVTRIPSPFPKEDL